MIIVIGSINLDLVARVNNLPEPGETVPGHDFERLPGGKGANQALAVLRAGGDLAFYGAVGSDAFADLALSELKQAGADLANIKKTATPTGIAMILVGETGENMIAVVPGANGEVDAAMAKTALTHAGPKDFMLLQQEIPDPATASALQLARECGATSILNTAPFTDATRDLADMADIVVTNETEFAALAGIETIDINVLPNAISAWAQQHQKTLIVTLGGEGVVAATSDGTLHQADGLTITPVDTVGAGDTFCGYLAEALHGGASLDEALRRAAVAGSLACLKPGAQPAIPHAKEVTAALGG